MRRPKPSNQPLDLGKPATVGANLAAIVRQCLGGDSWCRKAQRASHCQILKSHGGLDLLTLLRADPRYARLPFVLASLFGAERDGTERKHRPDAVALKPIRASTLTALLIQVLTGSVPPSVVTQALS